MYLKQGHPQVEGRGESQGWGENIGAPGSRDSQASLLILYTCVHICI